MQVLKSIGNVANGWAKFVVTLLAVGWFGVYAFNELRPNPSSKHDGSVSRYDERLLDSASDAAVDKPSANSEQPVEQPQVTTQSASVVRSLSSEVWSALSLVFGAKMAQLILAFLSGTGIGLASRPTLNYVNQKRRLAAARRRLQSLEEDRQLLAKAGVLGADATPPASIAPMPMLATEAAQAPKV